MVAAASVWVVGRIAPTLWLFAAGFLVAYILDPVLDRLETRGWSRLRAVIVVSVGIVVCLSVLAVVIVPQLVGQAQRLTAQWPQYQDALDQGYEDLRRGVVSHAEYRFPGLDATEYLDARAAEAGQWLGAKIPSFVSLLTDTLLRSVSLLGIVLVLAVISFHAMMVINPFIRSIREMLPGAAAADVDDISRRVAEMLGQYVRGQATMMVIVGCLATMVMFIVGLWYGTEYALVVGLIAGLSYPIPWVGTATAGVTAMVVGYVTAEHDPVLAAGIGLCAMVAMIATCDQTIMPKVIGRKVGLHPLVVIFGILAGYQTMGVVGMVLAAPIAASIKIILTRWLPLAEVKVKPGKPEPLMFDLKAAARMGVGGLQSVTRRIEDAVGMGNHETEASEQEDAETDDDSGAS